MGATITAPATSDNLGMAGREMGTVRPLRQLGSGGYGTVFYGRNNCGLRIAVKVGNQEDVRNGLRIRNEFRFLNLLNHPNIVSPGWLKHEGQRWYFSMQFAGEAEVSQFVRGDAPRGTCPSLDRFYTTTSQLASALVEIHRRGLVYGDLKPSNMRLDRSGHLSLFDFGSAARSGGRHCMPAHDGNLECTFQYLAPETVLGGICGPPADIYAMGRMCFELLTGERANLDLFSRRDSRTFESRVTGLLPPDVPAGLKECISAMMSTDAANRPNAVELCEFFGAAPVDLPRLHPRAAKFFSKVRRAADEAASGSGCGRMMLFVGKPITCRLIADGSLETVGGDQPILTLRGGDCGPEHYPGAAWGGIADSLARWHERLPAPIRDEVCRDVGFPIQSYDTPGPLAAEKAYRALIAITRKRPAVVVVEQLDSADALSRHWLCRLMPKIPELKLLLVGTARSLASVKWLEGENATNELLKASV